MEVIRNHITNDVKQYRGRPQTKRLERLNRLIGRSKAVDVGR